MGQFGVTLRNTSVDVTISTAEKAKFRVLPRNQFDDKGNVKPYKIDKSDPDWKLGGARGTFSDVEKGHWALFKLRRNKAGTVYQADIIVVLGSEDGQPSSGR